MTKKTGDRNVTLVHTIQPQNDKTVNTNAYYHIKNQTVVELNVQV